MRPMKFGIGQAIPRVEDARFVTGRGRYTDDIQPSACAHSALLRSPHAHATFTLDGLDAARAMPGVLAILIHADIAGYGHLPCNAPAVNSDGSKMTLPPYPLLADGTVRHVGDAVAFVVAETPDEAKDAVEAIAVEWSPIDAAIGIAGAEEPGASPVWSNVTGNVAFDCDAGDKAAVDAAFARAARTVALTIVNNRLVTNYLEPRACLAEFEDGRWTITLGTQGSHGIRDLMAKVILKVKPDRVRVITPDVGGGFGTKAFLFREYPLAAIAAERTGRPVKWICDRTEHFLSDAQGRDHITTAELALDAENRFLALRIDLKADMGAYLSGYAPFIPGLGNGVASGVYDIQAVAIRIRGYYTHTLPVDAYRGAGRPEAAYLIERLVDQAARETGIGPIDLRAKNFVPPAKMPYRTATGSTYDTGEFDAHMRQALERAEWASFETRRKASAKAGKLRGIGLSTYIEACAGGGGEGAFVRIDPDGGATVRIGTQSNGQGHETAYAQIVSQQLDLPPERIRVRQGDTDDLKTGGGTGGSRSIPIGGAAVAGATRKLAETLKKLAADALEAGTGDLEFADGSVRVVGTDRSIGFAELASGEAGKVAELEADDTWTPSEATFPNGTHICEVEIDPEDGEVAVLGYVVVDDFGVTLNPLLLAGQVRGGIVQGIGQALHEHTVYEETGQLVTASLMDYRLPRAGDIPPIHFETRNVPSTTNALGLKGAGEAGAIGSCPAVMNAVVDALHRGFGIDHLDMPATPDRVRAAIRSAEKNRRDAA